LRGLLRVETRSGTMDVKAGQGITAHRGEWVRYSTPESGGAEYIAVCIPAFAPELVHREPS
jgi:mannose-6-phosphate isomerase-like protein (cupin superfamily)